jgi:hypothetical protein
MHPSLAMKNCLKDNSPLFCVKTINKLLNGFDYSQESCLSCSNFLNLLIAEQLNDKLSVLIWTIELFKDNPKLSGEITVNNLFCHSVMVQEMFFGLAEFSLL